MTPLPIDRAIPEIREHLRKARNLVVEAPPGSGKTTRVPPALLEMVEGEVWVLEPRRLAARLAARRVAFERGERAGQTVGYQVRFEEVASAQTRLRFMTEGVLTRRMLSNPRLRGVSAVVLDEFHERHLEGDVALALLDRLQHMARPDLKLVVMSATLDVDPLVRYLAAEGGGRTGTTVPVVRAEGRLFELDIRHAAYSGQPLEEQVAGALDGLLREGLEGDVLVFLPGAAEIRRAARASSAIARRAGLLVLPLHGDLPAEEQDRAVAPADRPKLILSTNVAESSVTIEGVRAVIDSGLARTASDSPWTGLPVLEVSRVSKAAATQRAGRAGRTGPGRVIRLYSVEDFAQRAAYNTPEIERRELSHTLLDLRAMGGAGIPARQPPQVEMPAPPVRWFEPPPERAVAAGEELLRRLGAVDKSGDLTETGRRMAQLPLHPRLARLVIEAERRGVGEAGCAVAALLSSGERLESEPARHAASSDLLLLLERDWSPGARRAFEQIARQTSHSRRDRQGARPTASHGSSGSPGDALVAAATRASDLAGGSAPRRLGHEDENKLLISILTAFPDRVARRRNKADNARGEAELALAAGGSAALASSSAVRSELLVAVDAEERSDRDLPLVRIASGIEPEWLLDLFPERVVEKRAVEWNRAAERVEAVSALAYDGLTIEESRSGNPEPGEAARLLSVKAREAGLARFADTEEIEAFLNRVAFATAHSEVKPTGEEDVRAALDSLCEGLRSFAELEAAARKGGPEGGQKGGLRRKLEQRFADSRRRLEEVAPERIRLPGGRQVRVHYAPDQPPWIASRLQDFFGMRDTPRLARGQVPLVVRLLAPNQRPVQITSDLAGFWDRHYPQVRRELMRRYPRHSWPEKP